MDLVERDETAVPGERPEEGSNLGSSFQNDAVCASFGKEIAELKAGRTRADDGISVVLVRLRYGLAPRLVDVVEPRSHVGAGADRAPYPVSVATGRGDREVPADHRTAS